MKLIYEVNFAKYQLNATLVHAQIYWHKLTVTKSNLISFVTDCLQICIKYYG